jgi:ATP-dependent RNA helicase DDX24/MAK5
MTNVPTQKQRLKAIEAIKNTKSTIVLVATDVAARGIDIPSVSTVIHYDVPRNIVIFNIVKY